MYIGGAGALVELETEQINEDAGLLAKLVEEKFFDNPRHVLIKLALYYQEIIEKLKDKTLPDWRIRPIEICNDGIIEINKVLGPATLDDESSER